MEIEQELNAIQKLYQNSTISKSQLTQLMTAVLTQINMLIIYTNTIIFLQ